MRVLVALIAVCVIAMCGVAAADGVKKYSAPGKTVETQVCCVPGGQPSAPAVVVPERPTRPLSEAYIDRIKLLEGWRACEKGGVSGYNTKAEQPGECIPKSIGSDRLYDELLLNAATVDEVNKDLPAGTRAALVSLTHDLGPLWTSSYLGRYIRDGRWEPARELFIAYVGNGTAADQAAALRRRKIELGWWAKEAPPPIAPPVPRAAPAPQSQPGWGPR
jgi:GH24 family phage-related lysozyme (muramidase)